LLEPSWISTRRSSSIRNSALPYFNRGVAYAKKGDLDRAIRDLDKSIALDPKYAWAYYHRGLAYNTKGDLDRAIADFNKAIALRAMAYVELGKAAEGLPDAEKALELRPDDPATLDTRGRIFEALGRREEGITDFRRPLAKAPHCEAAWTP
jgi:tetratricopeptide (TPR) repeat protein